MNDQTRLEIEFERVKFCSYKNLSYVLIKVETLEEEMLVEELRALIEQKRKGIISEIKIEIK